MADNKNNISEDEEEEETRQREDNGNDGSVSDNEDEGDNEDEDDDLDSAQGVPKEGLRWQSDRCSSGSNSPAPADEVQEKKRKRAEDPEAEKDDRHRKLNEYQRKLRNAREKRRSGKICDQFDHIRDTMVKAGVIVPKGTKGTILAAAKEYISMLQEQQKRVALDNCLLAYQIKQIDEGALGASASGAVRQVAAKNGATEIVWPNSSGLQSNPNRPTNTNTLPKTPDYAVAFRNSPVAMAVATLGGTFLDCNDQFCKLTERNKTQVKTQTIFTLIDQEELTNAFDRISHWIYSMTDATKASPARNPILLRSSVLDPKVKEKLSVCLTPIRENQILRYLCVTLTASPPAEQPQDQPSMLQKTCQPSTGFYAVG